MFHADRLNLMCKMPVTIIVFIFPLIHAKTCLLHHAPTCFLVSYIPIMNSCPWDKKLWHSNLWHKILKILCLTLWKQHWKCEACLVHTILSVACKFFKYARNWFMCIVCFGGVLTLACILGWNSLTLCTAWNQCLANKLSDTSELLLLLHV